MGEHKILVSTDIGSDIDDALSLLTMLNSDMPINGVYTVNGNVEARAYIAKHLINLSGKCIPVGIGSRNPLDGRTQPYTFFEDCYIDDSFIDDNESSKSPNIVYKLPEKVGIIENGLEHLAESLSKERHSVFSLGPLTDIALLLKKYPQSAYNIERLYIMGGRFSEGGQMEHNFRHDMTAVQRVLESEMPITVIPGDLCEKYRLPIKSIDNFETLAGKYVQHMARGFLGAKTVFNAIHPVVNLSRTIGDILKDLFISKTAMSLEPEKRLEIFYKKERLRSNLLDTYYAALEPEKFWRQYNELINHLSEPNGYLKGGKSVGDFLTKAVPKDISIADLYVPYCYQNRDKIEIQKTNIELSPSDYFYNLTPGNKYEIVSDLNISHFKEYVMKSLR